MQPEHGDERLVRFLLGNLTEEEQAQVEDRALADTGYLAAVEAAEADLIDAYVRGELSPRDRHSFELRFLTSPQRRNKVAFARALATVAGESRVCDAPAATRQFFTGLFGRWVPVLQFGAAMATLICIAGAAWLIFENAALRSRVAATDAARLGLEAREQNLRRQLDEEQALARSVIPESKEPPARDMSRAPVVASLVLLPGLSRAQTSVARLLLSPSAQMARIEIQLEARDSYPRFRAELRTRSGEEVLVRSNLARRRTGGAYFVVLDVPASAISPGPYELALKGAAADQALQDVGYYYFTVQRP